MNPMPAEHEGRKDSKVDSAKGFMRRLSMFGSQGTGTPAVPKVEPQDGEAKFGSVTSIHSQDKMGRKALTTEKLQSTLMKAKKECTHPTGLLAVHIKRLILENVDMYKLFQRYHATMYIRVSVQGQIKCTTAYHNITSPSTILLDELKHFRLKVTNKRTDPSNHIRIELVACPSSSSERVHRVICAKDIHLYEIIKSLFSVDPIPMRSMDKQIGELEVEFCFAYGTFGYGYSSQFDNRQKKPEEQISHSMFCRAEPPEGREDFDTDVMTCRQIGHPSFIEFQQTVNIGETTAAFGQDMQFYPELQTVEEPYILISRIKKRIHEMEREYGAQSSRSERLQFLRRIVSQPGYCAELDNTHFEVGNDYRMRYSSIKNPSDGESDKQALNMLSQALGMAAGISSRERPSTAMPNEGGPTTFKEKTQKFLGRLFKRDSDDIPPAALRSRSRGTSARSSEKTSDEQSDIPLVMVDEAGNERPVDNKPQMEEVVETSFGAENRRDSYDGRSFHTSPKPAPTKLEDLLSGVRGMKDKLIGSSVAPEPPRVLVSVPSPNDTDEEA